MTVGVDELVVQLFQIIPIKGVQLNTIDPAINIVGKSKGESLWITFMSPTEGRWKGGFATKLELATIIFRTWKHCPVLVSKREEGDIPSSACAGITENIPNELS